VRRQCRYSVPNRLDGTTVLISALDGVCPNNGVTGLDTPAEVGGKDQQ
jgi:hypothetical protein